MNTQMAHVGAYVICIRNDGFPASLERRKIYRALPDPEGNALGHLRIVDESGDDYLYPREYFLDVDLPKATLEALEST